MIQNEYQFYPNNHNLQSAKLIYDEIKQYLPEIKSSMDVGCGMAAFSKVLQDSEVPNIILSDHPAIDISQCFVKENFRFIPCNLDNDLPDVVKVDLIICTEVLEHLSNIRSKEVLKYLTLCSDIILFSAAIPRQGGLGHINEQRHQYWIDLFEKEGYSCFDKFKINLLEKDEVVYWLRQNLFIFYRNQSSDSKLNTNRLFTKDFELVNNYILNKPIGIKESFHLFLNSIKRYLTSN